MVVALYKYFWWTLNKNLFGGHQIKRYELDNKSIHVWLLKNRNPSGGH
jgi:hypothetical protein